MRLCIFCLRHESDMRPWCMDNPGKGCTYGFGHEYPVEEVKAEPVKKQDKKLCAKCGLHPKNPLSATNGCAHEYPA